MRIPIWIAFLSLGTLHAQQTTSDDPLTLTVSASDTPSITFHNQSSKSITAYVTAWTCGNGFFQTDRAISQPGSAKAPGATWTEMKRDGFQYQTCTPKVDYVLFADGSHWGPDSTKSAQWIAAVNTGWNNAMHWLKRKQSTEGDAAVLEVIRTDGAITRTAGIAKNPGPTEPASPAPLDRASIR